MICSSLYLPLDKSCFLATKDSYVTACLRMFTAYFGSEISQCIYFCMLDFIMLNMTPFYADKRVFQLCPKEPHVLSQCTPHWGALGHFFLTHLTVNISKCIQDPQALESLKCRYYIEVQTGILGIPNCLFIIEICSEMYFLSQ